MKEAKKWIDDKKLMHPPVDSSALQPEVVICSVFGIDTSEKAIEILKNSTVEPFTKAIQFKCCNFMDIDQCKYDIVLASNLYQILQKKHRDELRNKIADLLKLQGLLFLNNLSTNDPEEYGKGEHCQSEKHSFKNNNKYLHFCTREELEEDFQFLSIKKLYEHEYDEPRAQGYVGLFSCSQKTIGNKKSCTVYTTGKHFISHYEVSWFWVQ